VHQSNNKLSVQESDPKYYKFMPPCTLNKIVPAGKASRLSESVGSLLSTKY
jgi:hypothetical protein